MISAKSVTKTYSGRHGDINVLSGVDFSADRGETVAIIGPSGSGKSTLLHVLGTLDHPDSGTVNYGDVEPYALGADELSRFRNLEIGFVFQNHHLLPEFSALENVMMPALIAGLSKEEAESKAREVLTAVNLGDRLEHAPAEMSGGENQRVAVARAAVLKPRVILADEPTGNLDSATGQKVEEMLRALSAEQNITLIIVTHNPTLAALMQRTVELKHGLLTETGA